MDKEQAIREWESREFSLLMQVGLSRAILKYLSFYGEFENDLEIRVEEIEDEIKQHWKNRPKI